MAQTADTVAVELEARMAGFSSNTNKAAADFDQSMDRIENSAKGAERVVTQSAGKMGAAFMDPATRSRQLGMQIGQLGSQLASGGNVMTAVAQQASDFAYVLGGAGGVAGKVAAFFSGPWGAALLAAGLAVGMLASKYKAHNDGLNAAYDALIKNKAKTEQNEEADRIWSHTLDGLIDRQAKLTEELRKRLTVQNLVDKQQLAGSQANVNERFRQLNAAEADPKSTADQIEKLRTAYRQAVAQWRDLQFLVGNTAGAALADLSERAKQWSETQGAIIQTLQGVHPELLASSKDLSGAVAELSKSVTAAGAANVNFDNVTRSSDRLNNELMQGTITVTKYTSEMNKLAKSLDATVKAAKDAAKHTGEGTGQIADFIMPVAGRITSGFGPRTPPTAGASSYHPAIDIAAPMGTPVHAAAAGVVVTAGRMGGLGNVVIVDHGGGTITEYGHLSAIIAQRGQTVGQGDVIGNVGSTGISTGPHLDYRVKVGGHYVDPRKGRFAVDEVGAGQKGMQAAAQAEQQAQRDAAKQAAYEAELSQLEQQILGATRPRLASADELLMFAEDDVIAARDRANAAYAAAVKEGRIDQTQADLLIQKNNQLATAKTMRLYSDESARKLQMSLQLDAQYEQSKVDQLQFEADNAKTGSERHDAMLRLLDAETALERIKLQQVIDATASGTAEHELAVLRMSQLEAERQRKAYAITHDPQNMTPGQSYLQQINQTGRQIDEAVDKVTVDGLEKMNDELTSAIMGTESLGEAFDHVADQIISALIRIAIQQAIIRPIANALFGGTGAAGDIGTGSPSGNVLSTIGSVISGMVAHRAGGGRLAAGQVSVVGEQGQELFVPDAAGTIIPNDATAQIMQQGGSGGGPSISLVVNAPGATAETVTMIRRELAAAAPTIVAAASRATMGTLTRTRT